MSFFFKKKSVIIFLCGGFGNNLFQISLGQYYKNIGYEVSYNLALLECNFFTKILGWKVHDSAKVKKMLGKEDVRHFFSFFDFFYLFITFVMSKLNCIDIKAFTPGMGICNRKYGYWQQGPHLSEQTFNQLYEMMTDSCLFSSKKDSVCQKYDAVIHVRRGDFSNGRILDFDFYRSAIQAANVKNAILVTDDCFIQSKFSEYLGIPIYCDSSTNFDDDFLTMLNAKCLIMSNSTFCYWASQLGAVPFVIYPDKLEDFTPWCFNMINKTAIPLSSGFK